MAGKKEIELKNFAKECVNYDSVNMKCIKASNCSCSHVYEGITENKFISLLEKMSNCDRLRMVFEGGQIIIIIKTTATEENRFYTMIVHSTAYIQLQCASYDWLSGSGNENDEYGYEYYSEKDIWVDVDRIIKRYRAGEFSAFARVYT